MTTVPLVCCIFTLVILLIAVLTSIYGYITDVYLSLLYYTYISIMYKLWRIETPAPTPRVGRDVYLLYIIVGNPWTDKAFSFLFY